MTAELPNGDRLELPEGASGLDAARAIGEGLARAAIAIEVDGEIRDLARPLSPNGDGPAKIRIITERDPEALDVIRHDAAHVLATAVKELYPGVKISIGPPIDDGFYYDFDFPDGVKVGEEDLERIEQKMREHIKADERFERTDISSAEALERFRSEHEDYKVELIEDLATNSVSLYQNGPFTDLCRGPHGPGTKRIKAVKLTSVAGAYWRGDSNRPMLTRIYGTAFFSKEQLAEHLQRIEEAKARDHRKLGRELGLFDFDPVSPGSTFWSPKGTVLFNQIVALNREMQQERGYVEVKTPLVYESSLWETSGHWGKYKENIFVTAYEEREFGFKPMNCPGHCKLYSLQRWSYRDLPFRCAEPGLLHRREPSGTLHGLLRVRHFIQ
ncbi:MAG: threonyl-tRNA synthetase, partial [Thermoleophilaceae bacterium]|nr:threonyl-tRNA synthetase [Thermoleophilaceae bacterium]